MISTPTISTPARVCQVYMTHKVYGKCKFYFSLAGTTFKERDGNHVGGPQTSISWKYNKISKVHLAVEV